MADTNQSLIDGLITQIWNAENAGEVTNGMVAQVMDFLNTSYKEKVASSSGLADEISERKAADEALNDTVKAINSAISQLKEAVQKAQETATVADVKINTLMDSDVTEAIDNYNEILRFLGGITDEQSLLTMLSDAQKSIDDNAKGISELQDRLSAAEDAGNDVIEFRAIVSGATVQSSKSSKSSTTTNCVVVYDDAINRFLLRAVERTTDTDSEIPQETSGIFYYSKWADADTYGSLDGGGRLPVAGKLYICQSTNTTYRWDGTALAKVGSSLELGEEDGTAFEGSAGAELKKQVEAQRVKKISLSAGTSSATLSIIKDEERMDLKLPMAASGNAGLMSADDKNKLDEIDSSSKGTVTKIKLNGSELSQDEDGTVSIDVNDVEVDSTLDDNSTNPVQNKVVTQAIQKIEDNTLADVDAELNDDGTEVHIGFLNKAKTEFAGVDIPVGTGGSSSDSSTAKIVLTANVSNSIIRDGDAVMLTYSYDHRYLSGDQAGESTGQRATIDITVKSGTVTTYTATHNEVSRGDYSLDITDYLRTGTTDIILKASVVDPETGATKVKQTTLRVKSLALSLTSSYSLVSTISTGGYTPSETVAIPFTVTGTGNKTVKMYLDGIEYDTKTITKSGKTNGSFAVPMTALSLGRHNIQMVAELEASEDLTLLSESIYIDILKKPASGNVTAPFIGTMITFADGRIFEGPNYISPSIEVQQYEKLSFDFVVYDPSKTPAEIAVYHNGEQTQMISTARTVQIYTNRYTTAESDELVLKCGTTSYKLNINVTESSIDIAEVTDSLRFKLSANGRSNSESNPAKWSYGNVETEFSDFDWETNGWTGDALLLSGGASIAINDKPFAADMTATGCTIEAEIRCSNVTDKTAEVMSCMSGGVGFRMTTEDASMAVSGGQSVETKFAPDIWLKIAFVVEAKSENKLLQLYVNGIRDRVVQYSSAASLIQAEPTNIKAFSNGAEVEIRNIRVYDRALSDDEVLSNYIVDRQTADEMVLLYEKNDVLTDDGEISIEKLRQQGKSVMRIVGDVDLVNQTNNKKFETTVDIYFYSQYGAEYDFVAKNIGLRIQGTSSTTYPRKNYRLYFYRPANGCTLEVNGVNVPDMKYAFKPGARPISIFCLKADFSDSSSVHNTATVRIVNEVFKKCGWTTPAQDANTSEYDVRIGVDGFPMNLFYDNNGDGTATFLGKYNFNNEKADSAIVYGFEGIEGYNDEETLAGVRNKCICLEFLNNSEPLCLFTTDDMTNFDDALEFRFKADKTWATADEEDKAAVQRLWSWILSCKGNPEKFEAEYKDYFINESPFAWYIVTDYKMAVDNRVKNMMIVTWDGIHWMFIPYDMDTLLGLRNDALLKFAYNIDWDSYDESQQAYCFAGHDSVLWELVRGCKTKLAEIARTIRANMSTEYVLNMYNVEFMGAWSERVYNKDGEYKYITPLLEDGKDYLYALQGSRYAHRTYMIKNRFSLLDARYCAGTYRDDAFPMYLSYDFASDPRTLRLTATELHYFGYGMTNGDPTVWGIEGNEDQNVTLTFTKKLIVNDPQNVYGASRIATLDLTNISHAIVGTLNLNKCTQLQDLEMSCADEQTSLTNLMVASCGRLSSLDINGLHGLTTLDLSGNKKLANLYAGNTKLTSIAFATGCKLVNALLPSTLQTLELRYMPNISNKLLGFSATPAVTRLVVDNCPRIDWQLLLGKCPYVKYLRVTGVNMTGKGDELRDLKTMGGVDESGANVTTCRLVGTYNLTNMVSEEEYAELSEHFPELNINQPEWTVIKYDETVSDGANVSNLDNETGYDYDKDFAESGHTSKILAKRHRVMAKYVENGKMLICQLDDADSRKYYDGTEANLNGFNHATKADEGDMMVYEPNRWCKGIDDFINHCHYDCFSSLDKVTGIEGKKLFASDMELIDQKGCRVASTYDTLDDCLAVFDTYSVYVAPVSGYKRVRWPAVNSAAYGAVFLDADNNIISRAAATAGRMVQGSYLFTTIPAGAERIAFTCYREAEFSFVWLTKSEEIHAIEPDAWQTGEYLCGVNKAYYANGQIRSIAGVAPTVNTSQSQFATYCSNRGEGFVLITYAMGRDIARLFWAKYGDRDSSKVCGYGSGSNSTSTGLTAFLGMKDTISNPSGSIGASGGYYYDDTKTLRSVTSINALGYDNLWGNVSEWQMNVHSEYLTYYIKETLSDNERKVKSASTDGWISELHNGLYMDIVPVLVNATETTHYCDKFWPNNVAGRVLLRSGRYANSYYGVACAVADRDASDAYADCGSRLAFIGTIEWAISVSAYLEAEAIA